MSASGVIAGLSGQAANNATMLTNLGKSLTKAENNFNNAVTTGKDPGQIAAAKMAFEKEAQKLQAKIGIMESLNRIIDQIIARIGQIGQ